MSAFVVDPVHIDAILSVAVNGPSDGSRPHGLPWIGPYLDELVAGPVRGPIRAESADAAGRALLAECVASVAHRYPDDRRDELPGMTPGLDPGRYEWTDLGRPMGAIECCKAIDCYEYQSCEHPAWWGSGAKAFCGRLRSALTGVCEGYEEAPWEWTLEVIRARRHRVARV